MSDIRRTDTGVYTAEGMLAGSRAAKLTIARGAQVAKYEQNRKAISESAQSETVKHIDAKFTKTTTTGEEDFKAKTVGLVSASEFRRAREIVAKREAEAKMKQEEREQLAKAAKVVELKKKRKAATLSFSIEELEGEEEAGLRGSPKAPAAAAAAAPLVDPKRSKFGKDPTVETNFLPDKDREEAERLRREALKQEWMLAQETVKLEKLTITYSYWDGSGHRRDITVTKGTSIGKFLEQVRLDIVSEFPELRAVSAENLLYIKEDLIIPHNFTFYELILTKARGKSGPLFHFDVHDDVRLTHDASVEKDESHPGKIVERHWYERNKHIFPASRWEVYDPAVKRDKYTIHGSEVR